MGSPRTREDRIARGHRRRRSFVGSRGRSPDHTRVDERTRGRRQAPWQGAPRGGTTETSLIGDKLSPRAESDLDEIWYYIVSGSGSIEIADRFLESIAERFELLANYPNMG